MHRAGFASQLQATDRDDGLELIDCAITAVGHCAPPGNKPTPGELENCRPWFEETLDLVPARVYLALGAIAWQGLNRQAKARGWLEGPAAKFGHGVVAPLRPLSRPPRPISDKREWQHSHSRWMVASYHPSRQNTNTGVLTEKMLDEVFVKAKRLIERG
jgi:uracil-DNA glycosylase